MRKLFLSVCFYAISVTSSYAVKTPELDVETVKKILKDPDGLHQLEGHTWLFKEQTFKPNGLPYAPSERENIFPDMREFLERPGTRVEFLVGKTEQNDPAEPGAILLKETNEQGEANYHMIRERPEALGSFEGMDFALVLSPNDQK